VLDPSRDPGPYPYLHEASSVSLSLSGAIAALTATSGLVVAVRLYETHRRTPDRPGPPTGHTATASRGAPARGHVPAHHLRVEQPRPRPNP
jgi:hypothetical protein